MPGPLKPAKHGRDHCPGGEDPIPCLGGWGIPDLILSGGAATATTGTSWPVPFPVFNTPHTVTAAPAPRTISDADGDLFIVSITDSGDVGNDRWEVETRRGGFWAAELITQWDQVATAGGAANDIAAVRQRVTWTSTIGFSFSPTEFIDSSDWMNLGAYGTLDIESFGFQYDTYLRTWISPHYVPANRVWQMTAQQRTGTNRGLSGIAMKFWFIGAATISSWAEVVV